MTTDIVYKHFILEVIEWNRRQAEKADDPKDKARYLENQTRLLEMLKNEGTRD